MVQKKFDIKHFIKYELQKYGTTHIKVELNRKGSHMFSRLTIYYFRHGKVMLTIIIGITMQYIFT